MSGHAVVVWEYESRAGHWKPYTPAVTQHLERANGKQLTRVLLSDADPLLMHYYVNLRSLTQELEDSDEVVKVRRKCYPLASPPGKGAKWECAGSDGSEWYPFDTDIQCLIEEAWARGDQTIDMSNTHLGFPYVINFNNLTQRWLTNGYVRSVRRVKQAPYPLVKIRLEELTCITGRRGVDIRKSGRNGTNSGKNPSMANSIDNNPKKNVNSKKKTQNKTKNGNESSNIARTILNNIFGHKSSNQANQNENKSNKDSVLDADSSSTKSGRRTSLDTVSTYLSQESRESQATSSTADLLNCSANSDDGIENDSVPSIIGIDPASAIISRFVRVSQQEEWAPRQPCPACRELLKPSLVVVALPCNHFVHLDCLNYELTQQQVRGPQLHIQCAVCGCIYGEKHGNQPPGTMEWGIVDRALPGHLHCRTIKIVYNIQSGIQAPNHPNPGREYYAVGFPRVAYLPDSSKGRKVLRLLQIAWQRHLVFTVNRSHTTGSEDVVAWNLPHKTEFGPTNSGQGYPDPGYLHRILRELEALGVVEEGNRG
ncbi:WWE domain [Popillia japonica]|uniref:E3 ubiquitin-protein ligase n=1 Tax=Popillia japonica TaxID=7064 RepID=A0AAW1KKZ3_POPJA